MFQLFKKRIFYFVVFSTFGILFIINYKFNSTLSYRISSTFLNSSVFLTRGVGYLVHNAQKIADIFTTNKKLRNNIILLEQKIQEYEANYKSIESMYYQISRLQEMLGFSLNKDYTLLPAFVFSQDSRLQQRFLLNRGEKDGVKQDFPVLAIYQNKLVLLGKVIEVNYNSSLFISVNDQLFIVPVISEVTGLIGILYGNGGLENTMSFEPDSISGNEQLFVDEVVLVNEFSKNYPPGIPIGKIINVANSSEELLIQATVKPFVNIQSIDVVFVLLPK